MVDSHDAEVSERTHRAFSSGAQCSPHVSTTDEIRHVLSIPAVKRVLMHVIKQGAVTAEIHAELRNAVQNIGILKTIFADLLLIALGPQGAVQDNAVKIGFRLNDESVTVIKPVLSLDNHLRSNTQKPGRKIKRLEISAHDRERLIPFLSPREAEVLSLRNDTAPRSLRIIAKNLHITAAGVALIEKRILAKLASLNAGVLPGKNHTLKKQEPPVFHAVLNDTPAVNEDDTSILDPFFHKLEHERLLTFAQEESAQGRKSRHLFDSVMEKARKQYPSELQQSIDLEALCFKDARTTPLLTHQEEQDLFKAIEEARQMGDETKTHELTDKVVSANLRFAISIALKYQHRGLNLLDLIQEAYIGLMLAANKFEWRQGFKFVTYAYYWVRQGLTRAIENTSRTIRIPTNLNQDVAHLGRAFGEFLTQHDGVIPTDEDLAAMLGWDAGKVADIRIISRQQWIISLESPIRSHSSSADSEDTEFGELLESAQIPQPEEQAIDALAAEKIRGLLVHLPPREEEIIRRRFGIGTGVPKTLEEIGQDLGLSRERIRQLEALALHRLKQYAEKLL